MTVNDPHSEVEPSTELVVALDGTGPVEVEGRGEYPTDGAYDVPHAYDFTCTYADSMKLRVANTSKLPKGMGICWYGDSGWIHVNRAGAWASDPGLLREKIGPTAARRPFMNRLQRTNPTEGWRARRQERNLTSSRNGFYPSTRSPGLPA